jgi:hypothetical protein
MKVKDNILIIPDIVLLKKSHLLIILDYSVEIKQPSQQPFKMSLRNFIQTPVTQQILQNYFNFRGRWHLKVLLLNEISNTTNSQTRMSW